MKLECVDEQRCADVIEIDGERFVKNPKANNRPFYQSDDSEIHFISRKWRFYKRLVYIKSINSNAYCLQKALKESNIAFNIIENKNGKTKKRALDEKENKDQFYWRIDNFQEIFEEVKNGEFVKSPVFKTTEGYNFEMHVYLRGRTSSYPNRISAYAYQGNNISQLPTDLHPPPCS